MNQLIDWWLNWAGSHFSWNFNLMEYSYIRIQSYDWIFFWLNFSLDKDLVIQLWLLSVHVILSLIFLVIEDKSVAIAVKHLYRWFLVSVGQFLSLLKHYWASNDGPLSPPLHAYVEFIWFLNVTCLTSKKNRIKLEDSMKRDLIPLKYSLHITYQKIYILFIWKISIIWVDLRPK